MKASTLLASAIAVVLSGPQLAFADCQTVSASDVAQDIQNCPSANNALKNNACNFGGAAIAEFGGNTCASNGNNFGVLQLTRSNLTDTGYSPSQYLNLSAQSQVCIWAQQVGNSNTSGAYQTLSNSGSINGTPVTAGMLAACFQFGPLICKNDLAFMQANGGACPTAGNGGVRATGQTLSNGSAKSRRKQPKHLFLGTVDPKQDQPGRGDVQRFKRRRDQLPGRRDHARRRNSAVSGQRARFSIRKSRVGTLSACSSPTLASRAGWCSAHSR